MLNNIQHISVNLTLIWIHGAQGSIYLTAGKLPTHAAVTVTGPLTDTLTSVIRYTQDHTQRVSDPISENSTPNLLLRSTYSTNPT